MSSFDAFQTDGFDSFRTLGFDARNGPTCVPTTLVAAGRYVYGGLLSGTPSFTLQSNVAFDALGRCWSRDSTDINRPAVYDANGVLLFTGSSQSGNLVRSSDAGQGRAVFSVLDSLSNRTTKLVCFNADGTPLWSFKDADFRFLVIHYVAGVVFAGYEDQSVQIPSGGPLTTDARRTIAIDASTGVSLGSVHGMLQSVTPDVGCVVLDDLDDAGDTPNHQYIRYASDLSTVVWSRDFPTYGGGVDTDTNGVTWFAQASTVRSVDGLGSNASFAVADGVGFFPNIAVDTCRRYTSIYIEGLWSGTSVSGDDYSLTVVPTEGPSIGTHSQANDPSTLANTNLVRINGKWSIFT
ncbi:MAG: hypothetical protein AAGI37_06970 [Planctomycetota bacterium]